MVPFTMKIKYLIPFLFLMINCQEKKELSNVGTYNEPHRPQIHFSPPENWMNDPNGMVFYKGVYHLFYQYYPDSTVWGPMHWGHATTTDLLHWKNQPVALYPDTLGYIFSGSAVADVNNTSGLGKDGRAPLVAIFTHHDPQGEKAGSNTYQNQSIAYSLDDGKTWTKYEGNPVLKNPGIRDFRDPKVFWHETTKKWIMTLAVSDRIAFYSSPNLIDWVKESEFGNDVGAHGGVWECPDLFSLDYGGETVWVLIVNINPGGPNGGSATQYFTGQFDGKVFIPHHTNTSWADYGPDDYAGVTWSNTGARKIFLGWMSNWQYANVVPTEKWRSATTIPRDLSLAKINDRYFLRSNPVPELEKIAGQRSEVENISPGQADVAQKIGKLKGPSQWQITSDSIQSISITISNSQGENVVFGYDKSSNNYFIDRTNSGKVNFEKGFATRHVAPRLAQDQKLVMNVIIDDASVELFADEGLTVMSAIYFPNASFTDIEIESDFNLKFISHRELNSIWK